MARYYSVEEISEVLGTTERTVRRMLNDGRLAGSQKMDKGKLVWRVHATKDLDEKVEEFNRLYNSATETIEVEANVQSETEPEEATIEETSDEWREKQTNLASSALDDFWSKVSEKFLARLEEKDQIIGEMRFELEDKDRQLKLLPDLEKQAAEDKKIVEEKVLETEALKKQISLMQDEKDLLDSKIKDVELNIVPKLKSNLETEREDKVKMLAVLEDQLKRTESEIEGLKKYESEVQILKEQLDLARKLEKEKEAIAQQELRKLAEEKRDAQKKLTEMEGQLADLKAPWWKKWFLPVETPDEN